MTIHLTKSKMIFSQPIIIASFSLFYLYSSIRIEIFNGQLSKISKSPLRIALLFFSRLLLVIKYEKSSPSLINYTSLHNVLRHSLLKLQSTNRLKLYGSIRPVASLSFAFTPEYRQNGGAEVLFRSVAK